MVLSSVLSSLRQSHGCKQVGGMPEGAADCIFTNFDASGDGVVSV